MNNFKIEKVEGNILRITVPKSDELPIEQLISNRNKLIESIAQEEKDLAEHKAEKEIQASINRSKEIVANINEMLAECEKLGIVPTPTERPEEPVNRKFVSE